MQRKSDPLALCDPLDLDIPDFTDIQLDIDPANMEISSIDLDFPDLFQDPDNIEKLAECENELQKMPEIMQDPDTLRTFEELEKELQLMQEPEFFDKLQQDE